MAAIMLVATALQPVPYLGGIVGIVWMTFLFIVASTEVHGINPKVAWVGFGIFCAIFAIGSVSSEIMARSIGSNMEQWR